ncbi:MAG: RepA [Aquabacterium sp.]|uniref:replication protein RepA n=1 Tax=Aquabacterium sp. TaxID=1872578 RepID=UPI0025C25020|nr:replication protein RepA [Aquabacterium sp.]MBI5926445.1 RepA [Aquabacterium sp.]
MSKGVGKPKKRASIVAPSHRKIIEDALSMRERADAKCPDAYMARVFVQVTLPHQDPRLPTGMMYTRSTGLLTLTIAPTSARYGLPYGRIPRLALMWMFTEIKRTKSRLLDLGSCQAEFMRKLGLRHNDSRNIARFKEQCMRLFCCVISIEVHSAGAREESRRLLISDALTVLWDPLDANQASGWVNTLQISEGFFNEVMTSAVPLKMEAYRSLSKSPFAMDIYAWLVYRLFVLGRSTRQTVTIPWQRLQGQFGADYNGPGNQGQHSFKKNFKLQLDKVFAQYPEASNLVVDSPDGRHLTLRAGRAHIDPRPCG